VDSGLMSRIVGFFSYLEIYMKIVRNENQIKERKIKEAGLSGQTSFPRNKSTQRTKQITRKTNPSERVEKYIEQGIRSSICGVQRNRKRTKTDIVVNSECRE